MHDWKQIVRASMEPVQAGSQIEDEVVTELASHIEELYEQSLAEGLSEPDAFALCTAQVRDMQGSVRRIERAKSRERVMNDRSRTLWLPGLVTLALLQVFEFSRPRVHWIDGGAIMAGTVWLIVLPFCGTAGAYLSRRAGGKRLNCLLAALFPSIIMFAVFCLILPIAIFIEHNAYVIRHPLYFGLALLNWTVIPAAPLLLGAVTMCGWRPSLSRT